MRVAVAYDSARDLLATCMDDGKASVAIWISNNGVYEERLRLNSDGLRLEFTPDGQYLRARNQHGWKVYAVEDILNAMYLPTKAKALP